MNQNICQEKPKLLEYNEVTAKTLKDAENGKNVHKVDSVDGLFKELDS